MNIRIHPTVRVPVPAKKAEGSYGSWPDTDPSTATKYVLFTLSETKFVDGNELLCLYKCEEPGCSFAQEFWYGRCMKHIPDYAVHEMRTHAELCHK